MKPWWFVKIFTKRDTQHIWQMSLWMTTLKWVKVAPGTITVDADFKKETTFLEIIEHTFWCASNKNNRSFVILLLSDDNDKERFETELKAINIIRRIQKGVENKCSNAFWSSSLNYNSTIQIFCQEWDFFNSFVINRAFRIYIHNVLFKFGL